MNKFKHDALIHPDKTKGAATFNPGYRGVGIFGKGMKLFSTFFVGVRNHLA